MTIAQDLPSAGTERKFFRPRRLGHFNIFVSDWQRSFEFYHRVAGFSEAYRQPQNGAAFLSNGNTHHDLAVTDIAGKSCKTGKVGLFHIALETENEVELVEDFKRADAAGCTFDMYQDHDVAHSIYGRDPDGNMVEVYADVVKNWREVRRGVVTKPKPVWSPGLTPPIAARNYHVDPPVDRVDGAVFHPVKTTHVSFVCGDYDGMLRHYTTVLGLNVAAGGAKADFAVLTGSLGAASVGLFRAKGGLPSGLHHCGILALSEADLDEALRCAPARGVTIERHVDHPMRRSIFVRDPDNYLLQFYVDRDWRPASLSGMAAKDVLGLM